jgi:cyclic-di-GMP-binding protein
MPSFDVVSKVDLQELDNAVNQAKKEIATRFDFQGTRTEVKLGEDRASVLLKSSAEGRLQAAYEVLLSKAIKRGVSARALKPGEVDKSALGQVKQTVALQQGVAIEKARDLVKAIKDAKGKVQASIQGDQLRITGKSRDELQAAMALLRQQQEALGIDLQFANFRD